MPDRTRTTLNTQLRSLANAVCGEVRINLHDRLLYATDASIYQAEPLAVVIPESLEDACHAVAACSAVGLPILPRGGGTSLAGQCVNEAVVIDLSPFCTEVSQLNSETKTCVAEAGVTISDLNTAIQHTGLFFAPDPSTVRQATIGGCIGNNAAGAHSIVYGRTSESVNAIEACLADGQRVWFEMGASTRNPSLARLTSKIIDITTRHRSLIRDRFPKTLRRSAGYQLDVILDQIEKGGGDHDKVNLAPLLCGSEGTLAVTLRASLKLHQYPKHTGLAVVAFSNLDEAIAEVVPLLRSNPSAIELLDDLILDLARGNPEQAQHVALLPKPMSGNTRAVLYVEYDSNTEEQLKDQLEAVRTRFPAGSATVYENPHDIKSAWALRMAGEPLLHGIPGNRSPVGFVEDNAIPPENLSEFVHRFREIITQEGTTASYYAHASVGVLHVRPLLNLKDSTDREKMIRIATRVAALAKSLGGVMSGEHGDGRARGPLLESYFGQELMDAFAEVKVAFDPENRLNPGNIVSPGNPESIAQQIRVRPHDAIVPVPPVNTFYSYDDQTDFAHAVERCNGAGVCRKRSGGVMCPSYQATLDERHSTRGRGNALRLAITGQSVPIQRFNRWDDPETLATLELCLSCKACKTECPSNVDIARLKAEYHAQRYSAGRHPPFSARVMGNIAALQSIAGIAPRFVNQLNRIGITKAILQRVLGIDRRRSLPKFKKSLAKQWGNHQPEKSDAPWVLLLADTFTNHNEPEIGIATRRVLEAFGYTVRLIAADDLTRARISLGLLPQAIKSADSTLSRIGPYLDDPSLAGVLICEPSCLSAVTDDWLQLKLTTPLTLRHRLAKMAFLPEQFIEMKWSAHPQSPEFAQPSGQIVFHAHCHQRALWGAQSSAALLSRLFGPASVTVLDTTCCGLAGSFGYTTSRYDLSMKIGELGVLPAARAVENGEVLLATGTSCRHQIRDGAGKTAMHPIQLISHQLIL